MVNLVQPIEDMTEDDDDTHEQFKSTTNPNTQALQSANTAASDNNAASASKIEIVKQTIKTQQQQ